MASIYLLSGAATSRRLALECFEPRVMLAADLATPSGEADGIATLPSPGDFQLPGSISGSVSAIDARGLGAPASGLSGVQVELLDVSGNVLAEAITDELGRYEFPAIEPGVFAIRQQQPVGFDEGFAAFGSGGGRVRDANLIIDIVVHAGEMLDGYNFVEPMPAISATSTPRSEVKAFPFAPPLTVEWTRPAAREETFSQPTPPPKLIALPPVQMRAAEPFIGAATAIEVGWEMLENSEFVVNRYRDATAALGYEGDSAVNVLGDVISCVLGYAVARRLGWRGTLILYFGIEIGMLAAIRDSLILNVVMLFYPLEAIKQWQMHS